MDEDVELEKIRKRKIEELRESIEKKERFLDEPLNLTDATFEQVIQSDPLVAVDCWAPWCAPCLMVAPIIKELAKDYAGKIVFGNLNVDENQRIAMKYGIMSIPTLLIFKNGKLIDRPVGAMPKRILEPIITKYL
jgi:thioredoxin 1